MKVRTVYNLERDSFDIIDLDLENALITSLAHDDKLTRNAIKDYVNIIASLYNMPDGTNLELIIENVANKLIKDKAV